jgi:RHS repeat-associated protein
MTGVAYSDSTPDVTFTLDRMGRQKTAASSVSAHTFTYDGLLPDTETIISSVGTNVIDRSHDGLGRSTGFALDSGYSVSYAFDAMGRFAQLSNVQCQVSYSYLPNSDLISELLTAHGSLQISASRAYETNRNLLTQVKNRSGTNVISQFDYLNDPAGRRTRRIDSSTLSTPSTNNFAYNTRSELTNAIMGTNSFGYVFDSIGNRTQSSSNSAQKVYTANSLNQYTTISNGGLRALSYDADGNMTNDSRLSLGWDGENRLLAVEDQNAPQEKNWWRLDFSYDYMSRRIGKKTRGWDKQANAWQTNVWKEVAFVYDGWNLVREIIREEKENKLDKKDKEGKKEKKIEKFTTVITNTYVWGLDLSGGLQGAGGIGGLVSVTRSTPSGTATYFPCYDANGNITDYVTTNGTVVAHREYDAFGNTIVATGPMVNDFNFWFSTKYLDQETGFYYYGYRYYDPVTGRWLSRDTIGELDQENNVYAFTVNAPVNFTDYIGRETQKQSSEKSDAGTITRSEFAAKIVYEGPHGCPGLNIGTVWTAIVENFCKGGGETFKMVLGYADNGCYEGLVELGHRTAFLKVKDDTCKSGLRWWYATEYNARVIYFRKYPIHKNPAAIPGLPENYPINQDWPIENPVNPDFPKVPGFPEPPDPGQPGFDPSGQAKTDWLNKIAKMIMLGLSQFKKSDCVP